MTDPKAHLKLLLEDFKSPTPDPMSEAFAVQKQPEHIVNTRSWARDGAWKYRQFGSEIQLRNTELPGVHLDLFRAEAETLLTVLAKLLEKPAPLPYRTPLWQRVKQWWGRRVWRRRHAVALDEWRASVIEDFTRRGPWG